MGQGRNLEVHSTDFMGKNDVGVGDNDETNKKYRILQILFSI